MPGPQRSSLLDRQLLNEPPSVEWLQLAETEKDFLELLSVVNGTPNSWLEWVEDRVVELQTRGVHVRRPLGYRLGTLWNGIILLQETKYLCDLVETTLRQALTSYAILTGVTLGCLLATVPKWKSIRKQYDPLRKDGSCIDGPVCIEFLNCFSFYQLTETLARNWRVMPGTSPQRRGFGSLFWHQRGCRDPNCFVRDMKWIRTTRNDIAHSRKLFQLHETRGVYQVSKRWLKPLGIAVQHRIIAYRRRRPSFLRELPL